MLKTVATNNQLVTRNSTDGSHIKSKGVVLLRNRNVGSEESRENQKVLVLSVELKNSIYH